MSSAPSVRPILFSDAMVRAILDGRKTVTRRIVKPQPWPLDNGGLAWKDWLFARPIDMVREACPYGWTGDRLWVREAWGRSVGGAYLYRASMSPGHPFLPRWRPSIHMPREASRILLEVTDAHVEPLHAITGAEVAAEGTCIRHAPDAQHAEYADGLRSPLGCFADAWDSINGDGSWDANPWVWAVRFRRLQPPEKKAVTCRVCGTRTTEPVDYDTPFGSVYLCVECFAKEVPA